ncbi:MAG: hypothetical protein PVSMB2_18430 [Ktedonobacteraceae bacterium]
MLYCVQVILYICRVEENETPIDRAVLYIGSYNEYFMCCEIIMKSVDICWETSYNTLLSEHVY